MSEMRGWVVKLGDKTVAYTEAEREADWYRNRGIPLYAVTPLVAAPPEGAPTYAELAEFVWNLPDGQRYSVRIVREGNRDQL